MRRPICEIGERRWLCRRRLQAGWPRAPRPRWAGPGRSAQAGWAGDARRSGAPAQAAAAGSALRSRRRLQEEARRLRRRGGGEAEAARKDAPRLRRERYGAASPARARAATVPRRRGAPDGGRRRAVGRGSCPGRLRPRGLGRIPRAPRTAAQTKPARHSGRPGGCALGSRGSAARGGGGGGGGPESAGLFGTARGMGSSSPEGRPGARSLPQAWREPGSRRGRASWSSRFAGKGCGGRLSAWGWRACGAGEQRSRTSQILHQEQARAHRLFEEPTGSGTARPRLGSAWPSLGWGGGRQQVLSGGQRGRGVNGGSRRCVNGPLVCVLRPLTEEGILQCPKGHASSQAPGPCDHSHMCPRGFLPTGYENRHLSFYSFPC